MAQNFISRGEVITLTAERSYKSGSPYRITGFNGVALITVEPGNLLSFQLEGVFELELADVIAGDMIYLKHDGSLTKEISVVCDNDKRQFTFGRAVTKTDEAGKFYCRLLQSE